MSSLKKLFRFLLQVQGAIVLGASISRDEDAIEIRVRRHGNAKPNCVTCGHKLSGKIQRKPCRWRHLDLFFKRSYLVYNRREGYCGGCGGRREEHVPWAAPRARHTKVFDAAVASFVQTADKSTAEGWFRIAWRTVGRIVDRVAGGHVNRDELLDGLTAIGVDETSYKRGHRYLTVVCCLRTGRLVWVGKGRSSETLEQFFLAMGTERLLQLEVVAMDMGPAYLKAVKGWLPHAEIVVDRFHVVQLLLKAIDEVRRDEVRKLDSGDAAREAIKGSRFALFRSPANLTPKDEEKIAEIRRANRRVARAYELRVDFERLWEFDDELEAAEFLNSWIQSAKRSRLEPLKRFAGTMSKLMIEVLGFTRWNGLTNAHLEGTANKIKLLIHKAYGFHDVQALMAMITLCCTGLDPLAALRE